MNRSIASVMARSIYLSGVAIGGLVFAPTAHAQAADEEAVDNASQIVVTGARKRSEDVQTVPIAITTLDAKDLENRNISNLNDLSNSTPGVAITSIGGGTLINVYVRGLAPANTTNDLNVESNVGVFIDGIYQTSRNTLDMISVLDVGRIEIAKGPQSALYGRSTFAGAMDISTGETTKDLSGSLSATVGTDKDYRVKGAVSGSLGDMLSFRVAGGYVTYDGYGKNSADPGDKLGGTEKYAVAAKLKFEPTPEFTAELSGFITHSESEIMPETLLPFSSFNCGNVDPTIGIRLLQCGALKAQKVSSITPDAPDSVTKNRQVSLSLDWSRNGYSLISVTGFTEAESRAYNDYGGSAAGPQFGVCVPGNALNPTCAGFFLPYQRLANVGLLSTALERVRTFSQEIRVQSDNDSPFQWLFGGSYFNSRIPVSAGGIGTSVGALPAGSILVQVPITGTVPATGFGVYDFTANLFQVPDGRTKQVFSSYSDASTKTFGIFGSLSYRLGDLRLTAEGRYNSDEKRAQSLAVNNPFFAPNVYQPIDGTSVPPATAFPTPGTLFKKTFNSFSPRFTADYQATSDIFLYASAAKGVRSGGFNTFNPVGPTGILAREVAYDEEENWTYEAGVKTTLFDRKVRFNASYFHTDWTNAQISAFTENPTAVNPSRIVKNLGSIKVDGFEALVDVFPTPMFSFGGSVVYSDLRFGGNAFEASQIAQCRTGTTPATYGSAPGCPPIVAVPTANGGTQYVPSLKGLSTPRSVKWQWNAHATADVPLGGEWVLNARTDVNYTGPTPGDLLNTIEFGKRTLVNARIGVANERYSLSVWANNLFDKTYVVNSINQPRAGIPFVGLNVPEIYLGERRRVGVTAGVKF